MCSRAVTCAARLAPLIPGFAGSHVPLMLSQGNNWGWFAVKACMQAAHAGVLQYSTSVLHRASTTPLLDKGHQVGRQPVIPLLLMLLK